MTGNISDMKKYVATFRFLQYKNYTSASFADDMWNERSGKSVISRH